MSIQMISHYRIVRRLGAGGMGEVLLAQDTKLDRSVAIKLMSAQLALDPQQRKRFQTEVKAASGLNHPNICVIHEVGETEDRRPFLAMEYVEGQTLDVVAQQRRLKLREIVTLGAQVADALAAAHARGVVHRDIKPPNIMLDARGQAKVLDFGLAKRFEQDGLSDATTLATSLTAPGMLIGTPNYMSPEQALGRELDHRSDIFSLGVVLYELAGGQRPFLGKTVGETINNIVNLAPRPLELDNPIFSPALDQIILKCLEKEPDKRYASAQSLAEDLLKLQTDAANAKIGRETPVATPVSAAAQAEATKLWQMAEKSKASSRSTLLITAVVIAVLGVAGGWALIQSRKSGASSGKAMQQKSVAVLPFDNYSAEKDTDYLSDGLTEEITTALARVPGLKVAARNSAFTFKGKKEDLRKVGAALGVATLLEGSIRKAGRQIRVTAQLVSAADGFHLWSEKYDSTVENIIAVQEEIALQIAEKFGLQSTGRATTGAAPRHPPKPEAYALYLQGLQYWNKRTQQDLEKAAQLFQKAIDQDASYAAAHAGLAACYVLLPDYAQRPFSEYQPLVRAAAAKALALDPACADAHAVLGLMKSYGTDHDGAVEEFKLAISLNPNHATARHWFGILLREGGRMDEAYAELRRAEELDPLSPIIKLNLLTWLGYARQFDRGLEETRRHLQTFPDFGLFHAAMGWLHGIKGDYKPAIEEILKARAGMGESPYFLDALAYAYARTGEEARARQILAELETLQKKGFALRGAIGIVHLGLRDHDRAMDGFEAAIAAGENLQGLLGDPTFDELRSTPRFQALLKQVGLVK